MRLPILKNCYTGIAIILAVLAGCSSSSRHLQPSAQSANRESTQVENSLLIKGAPDWVNRGSNLRNTQNGRLFHGVGAASPMGDLALQKAVADDKARAEVERLLTTYFAIVSNGYIESIKSPQKDIKHANVARTGINQAIAGNPVAVPTVLAEETVLPQLRQYIMAIVGNTRIIGSWRDPKNSDVRSIAELELNQVSNAIAGAEGIEADLKRYLEAVSESFFDSLAKAYEKPRVYPDSSK